MNKLRAYRKLWVALVWSVALPVGAATSADRLRDATGLFDAGRYEACLAVLNEIDPESLDDAADREGYENLRTDATDANSRQQMAGRDFNRAREAEQQGDHDGARRYYMLVSRNDFATRAMRAEARQRARALETSQSGAAPSGGDASRSGAVVMVSESTGSDPAGAIESTAPADRPPASSAAPSGKSSLDGVFLASAGNGGEESIPAEPMSGAPNTPPTQNVQSSTSSPPATPAGSSTGRYTLYGSSGSATYTSQSPGGASVQASGNSEVVPAQTVGSRVPAGVQSSPPPVVVSSPPPVAPSFPPMRSSTPAVSASPPPGMAQAGLVDELAQEQQLLWQQAVKIFEDTEEQIRRAVVEENFDEALTQMDYARQVIEANRRYAYPPSRYDDYRRQAELLAQFIDDEQRKSDERRVQERLSELEATESERIGRLNEQRRLQIEQLMNQALELKKERRYDEAVQVLKQVLVIDPNNEKAAWMREMLEDFAFHSRDRQVEADKLREMQDLLIETREDSIPWHQDLLYPKNWPEITAKRLATEDVGESEATIVVQRRLQQVVPELIFEARTLEQVVDYMRDLTGLNIVPNWSAMESAGIEREQEVSLKLTNVKFQKALELILNDVGAKTDTPLGFEIDDGVIQISTREDLSLRTLVRVYNVQDLLVRAPDFRGLEINLQNIGNTGNQGGGGGGGTGGGVPGGGGGLGGGQGGGGGGGGLFGGGAGGGQGQGEEDDLGENPIDALVELVQNTIEPESWRAAGGNVGSLQPLANQLIVTQTSNAHSQIRDLLRELREARALQIAVEARYITITRNFLEQIGVDLDVVLNNGNAGFDIATAGTMPVRDPSSGSLVLLPRQFSRLGFTPGAPGGVGLPLNASPNNLDQPFRQPGLIPLNGNVGPSSGRWTPIPITNNTLDLAAPLATNIPGSLGGGDTPPALNLFGSFLDNIQVDFLLRATQVDNRASDLDAPRLVLFNGQRAFFRAFIEQDYVSTLIPVLGDNVGLFNPIINVALTGRQLDVQATVSADRRYVTMTIRTFTQVTGDPVPFQFQGAGFLTGAGFLQLVRRTTQEIRTTVSVPDGGTLLIGGLKQSAERERDAGVPILSRIPVLKRAFSNQSLVKDDQVLLILIKPKIIIQEEAEQEAFPSLTAGAG